MEHKSVIYAYLLIEMANQIDDIQSFLNNFCCGYRALAKSKLFKNKPVLIVLTSKQGLPKLARLAQIYPSPSFSHHQAITTTIRIGLKFCLYGCPIVLYIFNHRKIAHSN